MDPSAHTTTVEPEHASQPRFTAQLVADWRVLESMEADWDALADDAIEGSPSSESWMLLPALRYLTAGTTVKVLLIHAYDAAATAGHGKLCGVIPLEILGNYHGLPVQTLRLWNHMYSLFPAPLLRAGTAVECVRTLFSWAANAGKRPVFVEFPELRADSAFFRALSDVLRADAIASQVVGVMTRAIFRPRRDANRYLEEIGTAKHRHEMRRQERRLSEMGTVTYDQLAADDDASAWLEEFIALESSGWKGRNATAFGSHPSHRTWLLDVGKAAAARGQLMMLALRLDGKPIAMKLNFLAGNGGYAFKIAFEEAFSKYSPGTLLELENIRRLHAGPEILWMDSLAVPDHSLKNRVWLDRAAIVTLLAAPGGAAGKLALSLLPLMRWLKRRVRGDRQR